jgi:hypothetical protein
MNLQDALWVCRQELIGETGFEPATARPPAGLVGSARVPQPRGGVRVTTGARASMPSPEWSPTRVRCRRLAAATLMGARRGELGACGSPLAAPTTTCISYTWSPEAGSMTRWRSLRRHFEGSAAVRPEGDLTASRSADHAHAEQQLQQPRDEPALS